MAAAKSEEPGDVRARRRAAFSFLKFSISDNALSSLFCNSTPSSINDPEISAPFPCYHISFESAGKTSKKVQQPVNIIRQRIVKNMHDTIDDRFMRIFLASLNLLRLRKLILILQENQKFRIIIVLIALANISISHIRPYSLVSRKSNPKSNRPTSTILSFSDLYFSQEPASQLP